MPCQKFDMILIDLDGTIHDSKATALRLRVMLSSYLGHHTSRPPEEIITTYDQSCEQYNYRDFSSGRELRLQRLLCTFNQLDIFCSERLLKELLDLMDQWISSAALPLPGAVEFCTRYRSSHELLLVTEGFGDVQRVVINALGIEPYFNHIFITKEHGVSKYDGTVFNTILDTLAAEPQQSVVIGDNWDADVKQAAELGFNTIWIAPEDVHLPERPPAGLLAKVAQLSDCDTYIVNA